MGLLLMQYEYQKAKQKANLYELRSIRLHDKQEQYTKRIANIEKLFSKKQSQLENTWNLRSQQVNSILTSARMSESSFNSAIGSLGTIFGAEVLAGLGISGSNIDINGMVQVDADASETEKASALASALSAAASQIQVVISSVLEAMKQAQMEELEAMEDRQREPIAEKDAEIQAEVAEVDTLMELAKAREEAAKGRLPDTVKGSVAHYGLS